MTIADTAAALDADKVLAAWRPLHELVGLSAIRGEVEYCDTTGIEPDIALAKYKRLVGGGMVNFVNRTVPGALERLGYSADEIKAIQLYIDEHETIEGAPFLKSEHLAVFDCAFRAANRTRSIHYMGHRA